jgi:Snf7
VSTIEFSLVEKDIIYGLKQGNEVLTEIHKEMSLEGVEKLMEETADAIEYQKVRRYTHQSDDMLSECFPCTAGDQPNLAKSYDT